MKIAEAKPVVGVWRDVALPPSETFIVNQMNALDRWRPSFAALTRHHTGTLGVQPQLVVDEARRRGLRRIDLVMLHRLGASPSIVSWMKRTDVVHAHFGPDATRIMRSAALARRPLIVTLHGYDITQSRVVAENPYAELFRRAAAIVAVSDHIRAKAIDAGADPSKVWVRPIGIPLPPDRPSAGTDADILFVGRLVEKKGLGDLIQAAAKLPRSLRITVIGDGPLRARLERDAAQAGLHISFVGAQPFERVDAAMRSHKLLCAPSRPAQDGDSEGLPMVFLEASARRLPVVSYSSVGVIEAVVDRETGLLAPEGDVHRLAEALQALLVDEPLRLRLGLRGRDRVEQSFDIVRCTRALEDLYDAIARQTRSSNTDR